MPQLQEFSENTFFSENTRAMRVQRTPGLTILGKRLFHLIKCKRDIKPIMLISKNERGNRGINRGGSASGCRDVDKAGEIIFGAKNSYKIDKIKANISSSCSVRFFGDVADNKRV